MENLTIPGLQPTASRSCVLCGAVAEAYCSRCGVAPYCSLRCQQRDWHDRHKAVCHNLARLHGASAAEGDNVPAVKPAAPLRRPHSPASVKSGTTKLVRQQHQARSSKWRGGHTAGRQLHREDVAASEYCEKEPQPSIARHEESPAKKMPVLPKEVIAPKVVAKDNRPNGFHAKEVIPNRAADKEQAVSSDVKPKEFEKKTVKPANAPVKKLDVDLVPKSYMIGQLSVGDSVVLTVEGDIHRMSTKDGLVCVTMHEKFEGDFQMLCDDFSTECQDDKEAFVPTPGVSFSYLNPEDGGWYRARCLTLQLAALLDAAKLVTLSKGDQFKKLPPAYRDIPEFCCLLDCSAAQVGDSLKCTIISKNNNTCDVDIENIETGDKIGNGRVSRWLPTVQDPHVVIPEVSRPDVVNNAKVYVLDMKTWERVIVRSADNSSVKKYDNIVQDCIQHGRNASPLTEPIQQGETVLAEDQDKLFRRGICKRTNVKNNKYLIELIESGVSEVYKLEMLRPCPEHLLLENCPAVTSVVALEPHATVSKPSEEYVARLMEGPEILTMTITSGDSTAPSGSAVLLTVDRNKENVNFKAQEMPQWKIIEENGGDVVELESLMHSELKYQTLPAGGCTLEVLDISCLANGTLSACIKDDSHTRYVHTTLSEKMEEYCRSELGKMPYLPKPEELCIAQCPPYPQWFRAIVLELPTGAGGPEARLCYMDYGNVETVPVGLLRKMLPEFVRGLPAVASLVDIKGFPADPTPEVLTRAIQYMEINDEGKGVLQVTKCEMQDGEGMYTCEAPAFIAAIMGK